MPPEGRERGTLSSCRLCPRPWVILLPVPVYGPHRIARRRGREAAMEGWRCVRRGDSFPWVEATTAAAAVQRSLGLYPLGDWTDVAGELAVFAQVR